MKKIMFIVLVCAIVCLTGCQRFESKQTKLTDDLVSYTALSETGDTLIGVKNINTNTVVITPNRWDSLHAEKDFIVASLGDESSLFRFDGRQIGTTPFERYMTMHFFQKRGSVATSDTLKQSMDVFYKAYSGSTESATFYFPKTDEVVSATWSYIGMKHLFLETNNGWEIRNSDTKLIRKVDTKAFYFIKDLKSKEETFFFAVTEQASVTLFDVEGNKIKQISHARWHNALNKMRRKFPMRKAVYLESYDISKI